MERQSQTRINLKEWTIIISWVIWGGEKPGRPPAELNQGPPTPSLRQDKKERTSHRTAAPSVGLEQTKEQSSGRPGLVRSIWWARVSFALWVYKWSKTKFPNCTLFPVRARNRQILRYFWLNPRPFGANSASRRDFRRGAAPVAHRASRYGRNTSPHVRNATTTFLRAPLYAPCGTISPLEAPARDNLAPCGDRFR